MSEEYQPRVSVIVPARDSSGTIGECVSALRAQAWPEDRIEVLVVDDGSSDDTGRVAEERGARVLRIEPSGPGAARNRGVEETSGEIILFTDADCAPDPGWVEAMCAPFRDPEVVATKGTYRSEQSSWTARFVQAEYESRYERMRGRESIDFIDTYAAGYRREAFVAAGGFDESFPFPSVEDQELGFRIARTGARMVFVPDAVVKHRHAADPVAYFRKKVKIGYWKMRVLGRYPEKAVADSHTPVSLKLEVVLAVVVVGSLPFVPFAPLAGLVTGAASLAFLAVIAPFCARIVPKNPSLASRAPLFLALRATALAVGMIRGTLGSPLRSSGGERRMEPAAPAATEARVPERA